METITLNVEGMSCSHCEAAVKGALITLPGVVNVTVSLASRTATVEFDAAKVTPAEMKAAVAGQGYDVV